MKTRTAPIPQSKIKAVKELTQLLKEKNTILLASISNLPGAQFQEIVKKVRNKAIVKVPKKNLFFRAIDQAGGEEFASLKENYKEAMAILFSDSDSFELAGDLLKSKSPAKAKVGQEAPSDIEIPAGVTELVPGPAISELGALGIQIQITGGKIEIKAPKVIAKEGQKISQGAADIMGKLDIKPFSIGFIPVSSWDNKAKVFYSKIEIDSEKATEDLRYAFSRALPFAVEIGYATKDTISHLLLKAYVHGQALEKLSPAEPEVAKEEETSEEKTEEKDSTQSDKTEGEDK